jgi:hypothetical protein
MAGIVKHITIFKYEFTFVFRHRFEKEDEESLLNSFTMWREWELGFFYRRFQIVGRKNFHKPAEWKNNHVYEYMLGINLLICKAWFTVQKGGMTLNIDDK